MTETPASRLISTLQSPLAGILSSIETVPNPSSTALTNSQAVPSEAMTFAETANLPFFLFGVIVNLALGAQYSLSFLRS